MIRALPRRLGFSVFLLGAAMASATAALAKDCAVTLHIHVPKSAGTVYVSGNVPALGPWAANKVAMSGTGADRTTVLHVPTGTHLEFKFTRGAWSSVEVNAAGKDVANRKYTVPSSSTATYTGTVLGWHDMAGK